MFGGVVDTLELNAVRIAVQSVGGMPERDAGDGLQLRAKEEVAAWPIRPLPLKGGADILMCT